MLRVEDWIDFDLESIPDESAHLPDLDQPGTSVTVYHHPCFAWERKKKRYHFPESKENESLDSSPLLVEREIVYHLKLKFSQYFEDE